MATIEQEILALRECDLDAFAHGVMRLDRDGNILYLNAAECDIGHRTAATTIGRNYFGDVAPCAAVAGFQGRFNAFVARPDSLAESFDFVFPFGWGQKKVTISLFRRVAAADEIYVLCLVSPLE